MATTPNQKPVPSEDYANMRFNAGKFDEFMTSTASSYVDRLGITHLTVTGIQASVTGALLPANNLSDVQSAATSRTNLGLGTVAVESIVPITKGGTGSGNAPGARANLGAATRGANSDITGLTGIVTAPLFADANAIPYSGWSYVNASSSNIPAGAGGATSLFTNQLNSTVSSQIAHNPTSNTLYTRGQTGASTYTAWIQLAKGGANSDITSLTGLTTPLSAAQGGTGNATGLAATATALATSRTFQTNLAITTAVGFTGAANNVHGVTGTLPIANGGTGATTAAAARSALGASSSSGVVDGSDASSGVVGELITNTVSGTAQVSGSFANAVSLVLPAGDWDVYGTVRFNTTTAPYTALSCGVNTVSATNPLFPYITNLNLVFTAFTQQISAPKRRVSVAVSTTIYLVGAAVFTTGTSNIDGYLEARRVR